MHLQRPRYLLSCALLGASLLLSACGFHLRGTGVDDIKLNELHVSARDNNGPTHQRVLEALRTNGVTINSAAPYHLQLLDEPQQRQAISYASHSTPAEYELRRRLIFQITNSAGQPLIGPESLSATRGYVRDRDNVTGSSEEEALLQREMREDLTRQLMVRLSRISAKDLADREQALERSAD
ncbi:MAG: LPS assembly lipoprotein LptE [Pseudomonas sp.]